MLLQSHRKEINAALKTEADYFGDVVILPFIDRYELVVLKTVAICEFGVSHIHLKIAPNNVSDSMHVFPQVDTIAICVQVQNVTAEYIMKCDDDTFVRLDVVLKQISVYNRTMPLYMGNLNLLHRPLRHGKWAVTYEVCSLL